MTEELSRLTDLRDNMNDQFAKFYGRMVHIESIIGSLQYLVSPPALVAPPISTVPPTAATTTAVDLDSSLPLGI